MLSEWKHCSTFWIGSVVGSLTLISSNQSFQRFLLYPKHPDSLISTMHVLLGECRWYFFFFRGKKGNLIKASINYLNTPGLRL